MRKPSPKTIRRKALTLWSLLVRNRDGNRCVICAATKNLNAHHIEAKESNPALAYDPMNGITLCVNHHKWGRDAAHKSPVFFMDWLLANRLNQLDYIRCRRLDKPLKLEEQYNFSHNPKHTTGVAKCQA